MSDDDWFDFSPQPARTSGLVKGAVVRVISDNSIRVVSSVLNPAAIRLHGTMQTFSHAQLELQLPATSTWKERLARLPVDQPDGTKVGTMLRRALDWRNHGQFFTVTYVNSQCIHKGDLVDYRSEPYIVEGYGLTGLQLWSLFDSSNFETRVPITNVTPIITVASSALNLPVRSPPAAAAVSCTMLEKKSTARAAPAYPASIAETKDAKRVKRSDHVLQCMATQTTSQPLTLNSFPSAEVHSKFVESFGPAIVKFLAQDITQVENEGELYHPMRKFFEYEPTELKGYNFVSQSQLAGTKQNPNRCDFKDVQQQLHLEVKVFKKENLREEERACKQVVKYLENDNSRGVFLLVLDFNARVGEFYFGQQRWRKQLEGMLADKAALKRVAIIHIKPPN